MSTPFPQLCEPNPWGKPSPVPLPIHTARTILRLPEKGDAAGLLEAVEVDRAKLLPWLPWAHENNRDLAECHFTIEDFRRKHERPDADTFMIAIIDRETGQFLGGTGLHDIRPHWRQAETGYWIRPDRWGEGLCTEAVGGLISRALTPQNRGGWGLRRIVVYCAEQNRPSAAVCEKLGLRLELRAKRERYVEGLGYHDGLGFAVLDEEWDVESGRARARRSDG